MLQLSNSEPQWLDILPGVRVLFAPIGPKALRAARRAAAAALADAPIDPEGQAVASDLTDAAGDALSRELIRHGILQWEGIGDAEGKLLAVTPAAIEAFLADVRTYEAADIAYVYPWTKRYAEGNGFAGSPNGTSAEATPATDIASSAAGAKPGAKNARTAGKSRKRTKAPKYGKSSAAAARS